MIDSSYIVCGQHYKNKLSAYRAALPQGYWPHWNFYESKFNLLDWSQEPAEDLITLYRRRAELIRHRYDHVIVWLSGGSDSDNVIRSFLEHNIHIDEIWHRNTHRHHNRTDSGIDQENHCSEFRLSFIPRIQEYQEKYPNMKSKIHTFDTMDIAMPFWEQGARNPYEISTYNPLLPFKEHKELCSTSKYQGSICHIYGIDKPRVQLDGDRWYVIFQDTMVNHHNVSAMTSNYHEEFFYWHPDSTAIIAKQAHIIKKWFVSNPELQWILRNNTSQSNTLYNEIIKTLIYPWWDKDLWQPNKYDSDIDWPEAFWFYKNPDHIAVKNWRETALALKSEILSIYSEVDVAQHNYKEVRGYVNLPANFSQRYYLN
jgi:hypothetical protein